MQSSTILKIVLFFVITVQLCCINNAERDNPLDPKSNKYQSIIRGIVYTYYPPYHPLNGVDILVNPGYYWTTSNQSGEFIIQNLPLNEYTVYASCSGYAPDSIHINLKQGTNEELQFNLNGLPQFINYEIISGHISRWWPQDDLYVIKASVEVTDPDGVADISQVRLNLPEFNFSDSLGCTTEPAIFTAIFNEDQLSVTRLYQILGHPFFLQIQDLPGTICESLPIYIVRIIDETPIAISPQGLEVVNSRPYLEWQSLILFYPFTYKTEVIRVDQGIKSLVWSIEKIDSDSTAIQVTDSLAIGTYFWTVSVEDEFNNWSRSKEAAFQVE